MFSFITEGMLFKSKATSGRHEMIHWECVETEKEVRIKRALPDLSGIPGTRYQVPVPSFDDTGSTKKQLTSELNSRRHEKQMTGQQQNL